jgi:hypothetical protein
MSEELLITLIEQVEDFLTNTEDARRLSERDRDFKDNKQWTDAEIAKLESRNQAAIVVNRIKPKVEGLKGLLNQRKTDPKAFPRTQKHEKAAEAVTDGLRFVADNVNFDQLKLSVFDTMVVEGYGAAIIEVAQIGPDVEVKITDIPWDRYYYDNYSRRLDFADKRFDGIIIWMYVDHIQETFNLTDEERQTLLNEDANLDNDGSETFDDRPQWIDKKKDRVKVCQHFFIDKGEWKMCFFTKNRFLVEPAPSPYKDEFGTPTNPIEAQAANIDRENNRFGEVRYWIDLQTEINHRRSKFLHLNSTRQTAGKRGAIPDVPAFKREMAKPDGHVEYDGEKGDFEVLSTGDMAESQFLLYQDGKGELDAVGFNAQLSGERQGDLSGRAISNLQQAATNELSSLYSGFADWEKRVYRQVWMRMKQFWTKEKWIRITDDQQMLRWVGFNQEMTLQQQMEERIQDESVPLSERQELTQVLQQLMQFQDPRLQEITEVKNPLPELDVDIMIELSTDSVNTQQEQFELFAKMSQTGNLTEEIIELSPLRRRMKDKLIGMIQARAKAASERQQAVDQIELGKTQAETADKAASAEKRKQDAILTSVQTNLLLESPPEDASVII